MEKRRHAGLALAQLISMLLIIAFHYGEHGGYGAVTLDDFGGNVFFVQSISMLGWVGYSMFPLIGGYFLSERTAVDRLQIAMVVFDVGFFALLISAVMQAAGIAQVSLFGLVRGVLPGS